MVVAQAHLGDARARWCGRRFAWAAWREPASVARVRALEAAAGSNPAAPVAPTLQRRRREHPGVVWSSSASPGCWLARSPQSAGPSSILRVQGPSSARRWSASLWPWPTPCTRTRSRPPTEWRSVHWPRRVGGQGGRARTVRVRRSPADPVAAGRGRGGACLRDRGRRDHGCAGGRQAAACELVRGPATAGGEHLIGVVVAGGARSSPPTTRAPGDVDHGAVGVRTGQDGADRRARHDGAGGDGPRHHGRSPPPRPPSPALPPAGDDAALVA